MRKKLLMTALGLGVFMFSSCEVMAMCMYKYVWVRDAFGNWVYVYKYICF